MKLMNGWNNRNRLPLVFGLLGMSLVVAGSAPIAFLNVKNQETWGDEVAGLGFVVSLIALFLYRRSQKTT